MSEQAMSIEEQSVQRLPESKFSLGIPENILSPPTSRSNSPVEDMSFTKEEKADAANNIVPCQEDSCETTLTLDAADKKKQEKQAEQDRRVRDEVIDNLIANFSIIIDTFLIHELFRTTDSRLFVVSCCYSKS